MRDTPAAQCRIAEAGDYRYIEQSTNKKSAWTRLAKKGYEIWWEFNKWGDKTYTGRLIIDGQLYTVSPTILQLSRLHSLQKEGGLAILLGLHSERKEQKASPRKLSTNLDLFFS